MRASAKRTLDRMERAMTRPSWRDYTSYLIFSLNSFIAALIAIYIGFSIGLPRPYWAMLTVYITAQPLTGALRSKALYRVLGTTLGGVAAVVIVPTFVNSPLLMSLVMALWAGICLYFSLLDRTPRAYIFMLAGYTAAIIGFPSVNTPGAIFDTALARVEEITLGIMCATVVHTIVFPRDVGRVLATRIAGFLKDAETWIGDALKEGGAPGADRQDRRRLAADLTDLHVTSSHLPFDTTNLPLRTRTVRALEGRLAYMLPVISAIEDRLAELGSRSEPLSALLADITSWAKRTQSAEEQRAEAKALMDRTAALLPNVGPGEADWATLLTISTLVRLQELIQTLQDGRDLARFTETPDSNASGRLQMLLKTAIKRRLHLDPGMAALSGLSLVSAVLICCGLWIFTAWPEGFVAAMMAAVFSSFFAAQDDPAPAIVSFLVWTLLSMPLTALYLFLILPAIDGFPMLALALSPALLVIGYFQAQPKYSGAAMAMTLGFIGGVSLLPVFSASMPEFLDSNLAECVGVAVALASTRLLRSVGAGWAARRILKQGWREVAALARRSRGFDAEGWIGAMLDRVGLVSARVALASPEDSVDAYDALADMRIGINVLNLQAASDALGGASAQSIQVALSAVADTFEHRLSDASPKPASTLLTAIDQAISDLAYAPSSPDMSLGIDSAQVRGFAALTGLRRNLFPDAAPFGFEGPHAPQGLAA